jgi:hypothetical protein
MEKFSDEITYLLTVWSIIVLPEKLTDSQLV